MLLTASGDKDTSSLLALAQVNKSTHLASLAEEPWRTPHHRIFGISDINEQVPSSAMQTRVVQWVGMHASKHFQLALAIVESFQVNTYIKCVYTALNS